MQHPPTDLTLAEVEYNLAVLKQERQTLEHEEKMIEQVRQPLKEALEKLQRELAAVDAAKWSLEAKRTKNSQREEELEREKLFQLHSIPIEEITTRHLSKLPLRVIHLVVKKRYDVDELEFWYTRTEIPVRETLTPRQYREAVIFKLTTYDSCKYCHSIYHTQDKCPQLAQLVCVMCDEKGHDKYHCTKRVKDIYPRDRPYRYRHRH